MVAGVLAPVVVVVVVVVVGAVTVIVAVVAATAAMVALRALRRRRGTNYRNYRPSPSTLFFARTCTSTGGGVNFVGSFNGEGAGAEHTPGAVSPQPCPL